MGLLRSNGGDGGGGSGTDKNHNSLCHTSYNNMNHENHTL